MELTRITFTLLCVLLVFSYVNCARKGKPRRLKRNHKSCRPKSLARYQMTVTTSWDKETFPKMYPTYRPPAHWSQLIGRSHGSKYRMWQEGANASLAVQEFAEKESSEFFDLELSQGYNDVHDVFVAPDIEQGVGETSTVVSVDGGHSKVSFMMKIVPSPDWFIGIDSVDLCYRGRWKKSIKVDLGPLDAGTDKGLTFTAPNWPTEPREPISAITSSKPDHPASSFYYSEYQALPKIASVEFEMVSEYRLKKVYKEVKPIIRDVNEIIRAKIQNVSSSDGKDNNIVSSNAKAPLLGNEYYRGVDCQVSEWTEWSPCSKTCGFGNKLRTRKPTVMPSNGGTNCPLMKEDSLCGSMRNCKWGHFSMITNSNIKKSPFGTAVRRRRVRRRRRKHLN